MIKHHYYSSSSSTHTHTSRRFCIFEKVYLQAKKLSKSWPAGCVLKEVYTTTSMSDFQYWFVTHKKFYISTIQSFKLDKKLVVVHQFFNWKTVVLVSSHNFLINFSQIEITARIIKIKIPKNDCQRAMCFRKKPSKRIFWSGCEAKSKNSISSLHFTFRGEIFVNIFCELKKILYMFRMQFERIFATFRLPWQRKNIKMFFRKKLSWGFWRILFQSFLCRPNILFFHLLQCETLIFLSDCGQMCAFSSLLGLKM